MVAPAVGTMYDMEAEALIEREFGELTEDFELPKRAASADKQINHLD